MIEYTNEYRDPSGCPWAAQVERYHDGEVLADQAASIEEHCAGCPACSRQLAVLSQVSRLIGAAMLVEPSAEALSGWIDRHAVQDRRVRRLAGWLTAVAAVLLLTAIFKPQVARTPAVATPEPWLTAAVMPSEMHDDSSDPIGIAQWMEEELTTSQE